MINEIIKTGQVIISPIILRPRIAETTPRIMATITATITNMIRNGMQIR